jgi:hypothetical protein
MRPLFALLLLASPLLQTTVPISSLSGSVSSSRAVANLTAEGTLDWVAWVGGAPNRKAGVGEQISTYKVVGGGTAHVYDDDPRGLNWSDGAPMVSSNRNLNGVFISGMRSGFTFTAPAGTTPRTLVVHVGGRNSGGTLRAHLSSGGAADYVDTTSPLTDQYNRNYTLSYQAPRADQTLSVTWTMSAGPSAGNVTLNAAALSGPLATVKLAWDPSPTANIVTYRVYRSTDPKSFPITPLAQVPAVTLRYTDVSAARGVTYYYRITAVGKDGRESAPTNVAQTRS